MNAFTQILPPSSGATAAPLSLAAELWVSASGSDTTGTRGNPSLPFLTIGAAITAASAGDTIHIGAGTYAEQVNVSKSRLTLRGAGAYSAKITYSGTQIGVTLASSVTDTVLENLEIDGQRTTSTEVAAYSNTEGCAILLSAGNHRTRINRVKITNPGGYAIFANNGTVSNDLAVTDCYLASVATSSSTLVAKEVRYGILNFGGLNHIYSGNFITGFSQAIGLWYGAANCRVLANRAYYNYGKAGTGGTDLRSAFEDYGATASTHGNNLWHGNYVEGTTSKCFEIATGTVGSTYSNNVCTFVSSTLSTGGYSGFDLTSGSGEPTNRITIIGNTVNGGGIASGVGMQVSGALAGMSATGNTFNACGAHGVYIGGTATAGGMTISGNTFRTCDVGIFLNNNGDGFTIADNAFINGANNQIDIRSGTGHSVTGNSITGSTAGICLYILPAASRTIVSGNTIVSSSASVRGIYINASDCVITDNSVTLTARANQDSTCTIYNGNKNIVSNNVLNITTGFQYAVYFVGNCAGNVVTDNRLVAGSVYAADATGSNTTTPNVT